jgi:transcriptional regulator with XRE-family HTH domain
MTNAMPVESEDLVRGQRLRRLLKDERWSVRQAELRIGHGTNYLQRKVRGEVALTLGDIAEIAPLLGITPTDLFEKLCTPRDLNPEPTD